MDIDTPETVDIPTEFGLSPNYPNPFNPLTTINYQLPQATVVNLKVYNISGQLVRSLANGYREAGYHSVVWDGRNGQDQLVSSGIYFYHLDCEVFSNMKRMLLIK